MDVSMPRMDGITALPLILTVSPMSRVALFSGMAEPAVEREALAAGAVALLAKELGASTLVDRLREICRGPCGHSVPSV
jgi:DNA-binding NarL/FixJ family response regulator